MREVVGVMVQEQRIPSLKTYPSLLGRGKFKPSGIGEIIKYISRVRGSTQEVAWLMDANHGGGYSYRLCKIPPEGRSGLTEECFQQGHLSFAGPGTQSAQVHNTLYLTKCYKY